MLWFGKVENLAGLNLSGSGADQLALLPGRAMQSDSCLKNQHSCVQHERDPAVESANGNRAENLDRSAGKSQEKKRGWIT